jgi:murein DD-endopeptidase MepM/ murein hydrolase activator NlpD
VGYSLKTCKDAPGKGKDAHVVRLAAGLIGALLIGVVSSIPALGSTTPTSPAGPSPTPAASPSASISPSGAALSGLQNREAQGQIIADLTAAEGHAMMLERSLAEAQLQLIGLAQKVADADRQLATLDAQLDMVRAEHQAAAAQLQQDRRALTTTVRRLYKDQRGYLAALLEVGGFVGLLRAMGYSDVLVDKEHAMAQAVQADEVALEHSQTDLERTRTHRQAAKDQLDAASQLLAGQVSQQEELQRQLQAAIDLAIQSLDAAQTDTPAAAAARALLVKMKTDAVLALIEQAVWDQSAVLQTVSLPPIDPELSASGKLLWPIPNAVVSQGFGPTSFLFEASYAGYAHFHTGIDLAVPLGTPVFAAADGVVVQAGPMTDGSGGLVGYGNYVIVEHADGLRTLYAHLMTWAVEPKQTVKRGQLIGLVGSTGNSTGPHTHFEVRVDNTPVDPDQFLLAPVASGAAAPVTH